MPSRLELPWGWKFEIISFLWALKVWRWEFWYHLTLAAFQINLKFHEGVDFDMCFPVYTPSQFEGSWGLEFVYHIIVVNVPNRFELP